MIETIEQHERIALQVSGGRDSLACLHLLHEAGVLDRIVVYWLNTGAAFPETLEIMKHVRSLSANFVEIPGYQPETVAHYGMPTDILPRTSTPIGIVTGRSQVRLQDTYSCCARVIMEPMHNQMIADDVTLIIRGQRGDDAHRSPLDSGAIEQGIQFLFPIQDWDADQVNEYLSMCGAPLHPSYEYMDCMPDCMTCTGWWEDGRAKFMQVLHPDAYTEYRSRMDVIQREIAPHITNFVAEMGE